MLTVNVQVKPSSTSIARLAMRMGMLESDIYESIVSSDISMTYKRLLEIHTPVDTGKARRSWNIRSKMGRTMVFENTATSPGGYNYPYVLEHGVSGKKAGPKTVLAASPEGPPRVYSSQAPGGISRRAFEQLNVTNVMSSVVDKLRSKLFS